jgi:NlpC/P60 family putative phage cell wall peptidase
MPTRAQVVECARTWLGTRWQHQASLKGVACDCAGLVIGVGREVFGIQPDVPAYGHTPFRRTMEAICDRHMTRIDKALIAPGDVILMTWDREPHHMGIVTSINGELAVVHAHATFKKVCEHRIDDAWFRRIMIAYRFPGVE